MVEEDTKVSLVWLGVEDFAHGSHEGRSLKTIVFQPGVLVFIFVDQQEEDFLVLMEQVLRYQEASLFTCPGLGEEGFNLLACLHRSFLMNASVLVRDRPVVECLAVDFYILIEDGVLSEEGPQAVLDKLLMRILLL